MRGNPRVWASRALLAVVIGAPAAASWHNLTAAGQHALGLTGAWSALVPLVLDAAALYAAVLALRDVLNGDGAGVNRALVWAYAVGSAWLGAWYADRTDGLPAALFFAAASVSAVVLWDRTLRALRRDTLRERGAVAPPTPRYRLARWVVAPRETGQAWRLAVVEGITDPATAVRLARAAAELPPPAAGAAPAPVLAVADPVPALDPTPAPLPDMSKADAVRRAVAELGDTDPHAVVAWLRPRGVDVERTYVHDVIRRDRQRAGTAATPAPAVTDTPPTDRAPLRLAASN